jgi:4a-hydroxytetrahydrobiopterin dehydratase
MEDKTVLGAPAIAAALAELPGWSHQGRAVVRRYCFAEFGALTTFVKHLAQCIEDTNHHPDVILDTVTRSATVTLTTHSEGRVTQADLDFARALDAVQAVTPTG